MYKPTPFQIPFCNFSEERIDKKIDEISGKLIISGLISFEDFQNAWQHSLKNNPILNLIYNLENQEFEFSNSQNEINFKEFENEIEFKNFEEIFWNNPLLPNNQLIATSWIHFENKTYWLLKIHHCIADGWSLYLITQKIKDFLEGNISDNIIDNSLTLNALEKNIGKSYIDFSKPETTFATQFNPIQRIQFNKLELKSHENIFANIIQTYLIFIELFQLNTWKTATPVLNRNNFKERNEIGTFVNFLPLELVPNLENSFEEFQIQTKQFLKNLYKSSSYPLIELFKKHEIAGKIFNVILSYEQHPFSDSILNYPVEIQYLAQKFDENDLIIHIRNYKNQKLEILIDFNELIFTKTQITFYYRSFLMLFKEISQVVECLQSKSIEATKKSIHEIIKYTENKLIRKIPTISKPIPSEFIFNSNFEIIDQEKPYYFKDYQYFENELNLLLKKGNLRNENLIICLNSSKSIISAFLIFYCIQNKTIFYFQNPTFKIDFNKFNEFNLLILQEENIDYQWNIFEKNFKVNYIFNQNSSNTKNSNIQYFISTSGTTGEPKTIAISKQALINQQVAWNQVFDLENAIILQIANPVFDVFIGDVIRTIGFGNKLVLVNDEDKINPEKVTEMIENHKVTHIETTPTLANFWFDSFLKNKEKSISLKYLIIGSEKLDKSLISKYLKLIPFSCKLINSYGLSECTIDSTIFEIKNENSNENCVGKPLNNVEIEIINENKSTLPYQSGEIVISGVTIGKKIEDTNWPTTYQTGDYGYWDLENGLIIKGRNSNFEKINGIRFNLASLIKSLENSNLANSIYCIIEKNVLEIFVISKHLDYKFIQNEFYKILLDFKFPKKINFVDSFPITTNGKINEKELLKLTISKSIEYESNIEENICKIIENILKIENVNPEENIFYIGFDSLKTMKLLYEIENLGYKLSKKELYENPIIRDFIKLLQINEEIEIIEENIDEDWESILNELNS